MENFRSLILLAVYIPTVLSNGCTEGRYGPRCGEKCGNCLGGTSFCQPNNGKCTQGCTAGYTGDRCKTPCRLGFYGDGCAKRCSNTCKGLDCDNTDGTCRGPCVVGYMGRLCDTTCPYGMYGVGCTKFCLCDEGCACNPTNGDCLQEGCERKEPRTRRSTRDSEGEYVVKAKHKVKPTKVCCGLEQDIKSLKNKLESRVKVPFVPMCILMMVATLIIIVIGLVQMVNDYKRVTYVRRWEKVNIIEPLQTIKGEVVGQEKKKKRCIVM